MDSYLDFVGRWNAHNAAARKQEVIPFRFGGPFRVMLIQGEINGNRTSLIVDTGSNHTIISSKFVQVNALGEILKSSPWTYGVYRKVSERR